MYSLRKRDKAPTLARDAEPTVKSCTVDKTDLETIFTLRDDIQYDSPPSSVVVLDRLLLKEKKKEGGKKKVLVLLFLLLFHSIVSASFQLHHLRQFHGCLPLLVRLPPRTWRRVGS